METYTLILKGGGEGYYSIRTDILNGDGSTAAWCVFDCGGAGLNPELDTQGTIEWTSGSPGDYIGTEMSIWCGEAGESLWVKLYSGVAPNAIQVADGRLSMSSAGLGTQGGTGVFQSP